MKKLILAALAVAALAGCGTQTGDRLASGAAIGGGVGALAGGVGVVPGAIIGAAVGGLTKPDQVNLGDPPWNE
ncbi:MAG: lipoprotein [Hyphomonadaceae bacterium]|nr:lipoprotein [Hyphomonadaceae bacterium]